MDVNLREADPADAQSICAVHLASIEGLAGQSYTEVQVSAWGHERNPEEYPITASDTYFLLAENEHRLLGFGWMKPNADGYFQSDVYGEITAVYVHPSVAHQRIGSQIYTGLESYAREKNIDSLGLWASLNAVPFYEAHGYTQVIDHVHEFDDSIEGTVVEMRKPLED
ncbi:GNAT family N-acetyltransferase (plasmid) [Haladaptatus sp. SPP-AMP-3]|uniref:GNAT family N-acetyltransferase n=1 Tax=Haladaptatus sp. SPP-AMP-3 TaxID=3121295 RepID=UPI003C2E024E